MAMKLLHQLPRLSVFVVGAVAAQAQFYVAADDFSTALNPAGTWRYGQEATLGGSFTLLATPLDLSPGTDPGSILGWSNGTGFPFVAVNTTPGPITAGTTIYPGDTVAMHPDNSGNFSVLRWTAPSTGSYLVTTTFFDIPNADPATVDVHVLHNSVSLFTDSLYNVVTSTGYTSGPLALTLGDTIDFIVGDGSNGYINDHTAITAQITAVPEPSTFALLALGSGFLLWRTRRKFAGQG
jgi:hypothetical protein